MKSCQTVLYFFSVEIITQSLEAQRQQLLAEFEAERTNHQRVLRDYDRLEQRYQNLQDELEIEKLSPAPRRVSGEAHMGFDGLISASSSGSSQNILLQDLYIVFQNALFVSTVHGSYPPTPPLNQCYQGP